MRKTGRNIAFWKKTNTIDRWFKAENDTGHWRSRPTLGRGGEQNIQIKLKDLPLGGTLNNKIVLAILTRILIKIINQKPLVFNDWSGSYVYSLLVCSGQLTVCKTGVQFRLDRMWCERRVWSNQVNKSQWHVAWYTQGYEENKLEFFRTIATGKREMKKRWWPNAIKSSDGSKELKLNNVSFRITYFSKEF